MRKIILFFVIIICVTACATKKQNVFINSDCSKYSYILDSLTYIEFPDEYNYYVEDKLLPRKENNIFKNIEKSDEGIIPCLIEKLKDTTQTNIRYADSYNYTHSDVAFLVLPYVSKTKKIYLDDILYDEFKKEFKNNNLFFEHKIMVMFFSLDKKANYNNRLRLYKRVKKWYLRNFENPQKSIESTKKKTIPIMNER